jgi:prepilin-type N-terminal cleavage/methylation domain-containing protein
MERIHIRKVRAFTLVELIVVIGIVTLIASILLPAINRARERGRQVVCASNLRQIGEQLLIYANRSHGWLYPVGPAGGDGLPTTLGTTVDRSHRWPVYVFGVWNPPIMLCPSDDHPAEQHSYLLNEHLADHQIQYSTSRLGGLYASGVVIMGEKISGISDYYMERDEFARVVEPFRHGLFYGSNYLYMDLHVSSAPPTAAKQGIDPWDVPIPPKPQPTN